MSPGEQNIPDEMFDITFPESEAARTYFRRAVYSVNVAANQEVNCDIRALMMATCAHNCRSLTECFDARIELLKHENPDSQIELLRLPFRDLIKQVADHDLHGIPVPECQPGIVMTSFKSSKSEARLVSSHGVTVQLQFSGPRPVVRTSPKDMKNAKFIPGDGLTYHCSSGELFVHWMGKDVILTVALHKFLLVARRCLQTLFEQQGLHE